MENQVEKLYKKARYWIYFIVLTGIAAFLCMVLIISGFIGTPFTMVKQEIQYGGWMQDKVYLGIFCILFGVLCSYIYFCIEFERELNLLDMVILKDCNGIEYYEKMKYAVEYGKKLDLKHHYFQRMLFEVFEHKYVCSLLINKRLEEAKSFSENEWIGSKKTWIYSINVMNVKLWTCVFNEDLRKKELFVSPSCKFWNRINKLSHARYYILNGEYENAIHILKRLGSKTLYHEVVKHTLLAECYKQLGDIEETARCMEYVSRHGNNLKVKERADHWLKENGRTVSRLWT